MLKWQKEVEEIIKNRFPDGDSSEMLKEATKIVSMVEQMDPPAGELGEVVNEMMARASQDVPPLVSTYAGFMLGVAWERLHAG